MEYERIRHRPGDQLSALIRKGSGNVTYVEFIRTDKPLTLFGIGETGVFDDTNQTESVVQTVTVNFPPFPPYIGT